MERFSHYYIPYIGAVSSSFSPGKVVKVFGIIPSNATRFIINLQCNLEVRRSDIALQISINVPNFSALLNSMQKNVWKEATFIPSLPLVCGDPFEVAIFCNYTHYQVLINGQHISDFPHRIEYSRVTHIVIQGDVNIQQIAYEMEPTTPPYQKLSLLGAVNPVEHPLPTYSEANSNNVAPSSMNYGSCGLPMPATNKPPHPSVVSGYKRSQNLRLVPPVNRTSSYQNYEPSTCRKILMFVCFLLFVVAMILLGIRFRNSIVHHHLHRHKELFDVDS